MSKKSSKKRIPRNPQADEVKRLNYIWNKLNPKITGVRVIQARAPKVSVIKRSLKKRVTKAHDFFVELWTPFKIFKKA